MLLVSYIQQYFNTSITVLTNRVWKLLLALFKVPNTGAFTVPGRMRKLFVAWFGMCAALKWRLARMLPGELRWFTMSAGLTLTPVTGVIIYCKALWVVIHTRKALYKNQLLSLLSCLSIEHKKELRCCKIVYFCVHICNQFSSFVNPLKTMWFCYNTHFP